MRKSTVFQIYMTVPLKLFCVLPVSSCKCEKPVSVVKLAEQLPDMHNGKSKIA